MQTSPLPTHAVRVTVPVQNTAEGARLLQHLTEERLVAGGTVIEALSFNWVGGDMVKRSRREMSAYSTNEKLPLIQDRLALLCDQTPVLSSFILTDEKVEVLGWITRNVRAM